MVVCAKHGVGRGVLLQWGMEIGVGLPRKWAVPARLVYYAFPRRDRDCGVGRLHLGSLNWQHGQGGQCEAKRNRSAQSLKQSHGCIILCHKELGDWEAPWKA